MRATIGRGFESWRNNIWLVVWNIFYFPIYWEWSSQLTNIFQREFKPPTRHTPNMAWRCLKIWEHFHIFKSLSSFSHWNVHYWGIPTLQESHMILLVLLRTPSCKQSNICYSLVRNMCIICVIFCSKQLLRVAGSSLIGSGGHIPVWPLGCLEFMSGFHLFSLLARSGSNECSWGFLSPRW